jgi:trigger factor
MEFSTKQLSDTEVEITIKNTSEEVNESFKEAYAKARATFKAPGFRVGKAPLEFVEKQLGDSVAEDAANILVNHSMQEIIPSLTQVPVNTPFFSLVKFERGSEAEFTGKFEVIPELKNIKYKKVKVEKATPTVSESTIAEELDNLVKKQAVYHPREDQGVSDGDVVVMDVIIKSGKKTVFEKRDTEILAGALSMLPKMNGELLGMKAGEKKTFTDELAGEGGEQTEGEKSVFEVHYNVKSVGYLEYPEINDEFAKDIGEFEDLNSLKERIKSDYIKLADMVLKQRAEMDLLSQIVADVKTAVPDSMVQAEFEKRFSSVKERIGQKDLTMETLAEMANKKTEELTKEWTSGAEKFVKEQIVMLEVARLENITVNPEELKEHIVKSYAGYLDKAGFEKLIQDRNTLDRINDQLLYTKVLSFLYENAEVKPGKEVSYETLKAEGAFSEN